MSVVGWRDVEAEICIELLSNSLRRPLAKCESFRRWCWKKHSNRDEEFAFKGSCH